MTSLSVFDESKLKHDQLDIEDVHKIDNNGEFVDTDTKLDVDMIQNKEDKIDSGKADVPTEDMQIKTEETILKTDSDEENSSKEKVWNYHMGDRAPLKKRDNIKKHELTDQCLHELVMLSSQICRHLTKHKYSLKEDSLIHNDVNESEMYKCFLCGFQTTDLCHFKKHISIHVDSDDEAFAIYRCQQCRYQTIHKAYFNRHILHHQKKESRLFRCRYC